MLGGSFFVGDAPSSLTPVEANLLGINIFQRKATKLATKAIANRLKKVISKLINNDQTGYINDRFIGENVLLIDSVIKYAAEQKIPGLLLFVDFEQAFDSLKWTFINMTLKDFS